MPFIRRSSNAILVFHKNSPFKPAPPFVFAKPPSPCPPWPVQERLWKQATAVRFCQEAAKFDRSKLRHVEPKVTNSILKSDSEFGRVREPLPQPVSAPPSPPRLFENEFELEFNLPPYLPTCEDLMAGVLQQLEEEDVQRLVHHSGGGIRV